MKKLISAIRNRLIARQVKRKLEKTRYVAHRLNHHDKCSCSNCVLNAMYEASYLRKLRQLEKVKQV